MSGIEILGLISSIITLVDTATHLYKAIKNAEHLPPTLQESTQRLPAIRLFLSAAHKRLEQNGDDDGTYQAMKPTMEHIKERAACLTNVLQEVVIELNGSKLQRFHIVLRRLGKDSQIEVLMKSILEDMQLLVAIQVMRAATEAQVGQVLKAVQGAPSMPNDTRPSTFACHGAGNQFNNIGSGSQCNNIGAGRQYSAGLMDFANPR